MRKRRVSFNRVSQKRRSEHSHPTASSEAHDSTQEQPGLCGKGSSSQTRLSNPYFRTARIFSRFALWSTDHSVRFICAAIWGRLSPCLVRAFSCAISCFVQGCARRLVGDILSSKVIGSSTVYHNSAPIARGLGGPETSASKLAGVGECAIRASNQPGSLSPKPG